MSDIDTIKFSAYTCKVNKIGWAQMYKRKLSDCWEVSFCKPLTVMQKVPFLSLFCQKKKFQAKVWMRESVKQRKENLRTRIIFYGPSRCQWWIPPAASLIRYWKASNISMLSENTSPSLQILKWENAKRNMQILFLQLLLWEIILVLSIKQCCLLKHVTN